MRRAFINGAFDVAQRGLVILHRQAEHQINIEIIKPSFAGRPAGPVCLIGAVNPPEQRKVLIVKALNANRESVYTGISVSRKPPSFCRTGISLERDLRIFGEAFLASKVNEYLLNALDGEKTGGAPTKKYCLKNPIAGESDRALKIGYEGLRVFPCRQGTAQRVRIEVTVGAFPLTPRDMNVEGQWRVDAWISLG